MLPDGFGPFRVLHQIGAGTLGPVFRAYDTGRDRLVAVKVFQLNLPPHRMHRLVDEFEWLIAAGLTHPNIATPIAAGTTDGITVHLVRDFVAAESLDVVVRDQGPIPPRDVLRVAAELAGALDAAAAVGVLHGAMHPRDVLISPDETRLTDLGVSAAIAKVGGTVPLRRPYSAPERVAGATWGRPADVFALAVLMHELLWARRPTGLGQEAADALTDLAGGDLASLRAVFARALAADPAKRFEAATEFFGALSGAFSGAAAVDRPDAAAPRRAETPPPIADAPRPAAGASREMRLREQRLPLDDPELDLVPAPGLVTGESASSSVEAGAGAGDDGTDDARLLSAATDEATELGMYETEAPRYAEIEDPQADGAAADFEEPGLQAAGSGGVEWRSRSLFRLAAAAVVLGGLLFGGGYLVGSRLSLPWETASAESNTTGSNAAAAIATPAAPAGVPVQEIPPAPSPPESSAGGHLLVRSSPRGALVFVDDTPQGPTPAAVRNLTLGRHRVRLVLDGYAVADRSITITEAAPARLTIELVRSAAARGRTGRAPSASAAAPGSAGALRVESRPAGAQVFVSGRLRGTTPLAIDRIGAGQHVIRLELAGYRPWSGTVQVTAGERGRVAASLER